MKKIFTIAWKDLTVNFRDPAGLMIMLATPLLLTLAIAFAFGGGSAASGLQDIPVIIVNHDTGQFGEAIVTAFQSEDLSDLVEPTLETDEGVARAAVDSDQVAAAVIIPEDLSGTIIPLGLEGGQIVPDEDTTPAVIEVYANPTRPVGSGVVRAVVEEILGQFATGRAGGEVAVTQLISSGLIAPQDIATQAQVVGQRAGEQASDTKLIRLETITQAEGEDGGGFDWLAYSAPSMAILFLMFTVSSGGRSILSERDWGTLPRMLVSPTPAVAVLGGKVAGIFLTGTVQMLLLYLASRILFGISWGNPLAVVILIFALALAATGWGIVIAAFSRSPGQAATLGTALTLVFGALAGNFVPRFTFPDWLQKAGYITPNAWGLDGFTRLAAGGALADIAPGLIGLLAMAALLFAAAAVLFRRQYTA